MGFDRVQLIETVGYAGLFFIIFAESGLRFGFSDMSGRETSGTGSALARSSLHGPILFFGFSLTPSQRPRPPVFLAVTTRSPDRAASNGSSGKSILP